VLFKSFEPERVKMNDLKKLIDELYLIYGEDPDFRGKFTNKDIETYQDPEFNILFGRTWNDEKYEHPIVVGRYDDEVSITMWSV